MLFGDTAVEEPCGESHGEMIKAGTLCHCCRYGNDLGVLLGYLLKSTGKSRCIAALSVFGNTCLQVERTYTVVIGRVILRRGISLALLGYNMQEHRILDVLDGIKCFYKVSSIVAVYRTVVIEAQVFEHRRLLAVEQEPEEILDGKDYLDDAAAEPSELTKEAFCGAFRGDVSGRYSELGQILGQTADISVDAHLVVVQDNEHPGLAVTKVIDGFVCQTAGKRSVTDHCDDIVIILVEVSGSCHADGGRDRSGAVTGIERIVIRLVDARETRHTALLAKCIELVESTGKKLIGIGLVTDVKNDLVLCIIEYGQQGDSQFDHAEITREMSAIGRYSLKDLVTQFSAELFPVLV